MNNSINRRDFLATGVAAGVGLSLRSLNANSIKKSDKMLLSLPEVKQKPLETVRIGYVGVGGRGSNNVKKLLNIRGAVSKSVCDIIPEKVERIQKWVRFAKHIKLTAPK